MGLGDLPLRLVELTHLAVSRVDTVQAGNPPVVVAGAMGCDRRPAFGIRRPVVFVDVDISRGDLLQPLGRQIDDRDTLLEDFFAYYAGERRHRLQRTGYARDVFDVEKRDLCSVRRIAWIFGIAVHGSELLEVAAIDRRAPQLGCRLLSRQIIEPCDAAAVGRPRYFARGCLLRRDAVRGPDRDGGDREFARDDVSDFRSVGRNGNLVDLLGRWQRIERGANAILRGGGNG